MVLNEDPPKPDENTQPGGDPSTDEAAPVEDAPPASTAQPAEGEGGGEPPAEATSE